MTDVIGTDYRGSVCIIGGGWYGCHIAHSLVEKGFKVTLFEAQSDLFLGSSGNNSFRLHAGYHYPRSAFTRSQIKSGLEKFVKRYANQIVPLKNNVYAISDSESVLDFGTYTSILKGNGNVFESFDAHELGICNVEGALRTSEEYAIMVDTPREYFRNALVDICKMQHAVKSVIR